MKIWCLLLIAGFSLEASAWSLKDAVERTVDVVKQVVPQKAPEPEKKPESVKGEQPANNMADILPDGFFQPVERHPYESRMTKDEKLCSTLVAPFKITSSGKKVVLNTLKSNGLMILKGKVFGGVKSDETLLDKAKAKAKEVNWLPMSQEITYGREINKKIIEGNGDVIKRTKKGKVKDNYAKADKLLNKILTEVDEDHEYQFKILLINNMDVNATALPGGFLHINIGVLDSAEAELVLSHEIGHVFRRHQTMEAQTRLIDTVDSVEELKFLLKGDNKTYEDIIARAVGLFGDSSSFSRQQELQADACAVRLAARVPKLNIDTMIVSYVKSIASSLSLEEKGSPSGHPDYPERQERMEAVLKMLDKGA